MNPISSWMFFARNNPEYIDRFAECFWPSQVMSKEYAITLLKSVLEWSGEERPVFMFGGWYGVFAQMLYHKYPNKYYSIDVDPRCKRVIEGMKAICKNSLHIEEPNIIPVTADMGEYVYPEDPYLVINTSTEHVSQETYDTWWNNIPEGTKYFVQGNNFFECDEHIRCTDTLDQFIKINHVSDSDINLGVNVGLRPDGRDFIRYMAMGTK